MDAEHPSSHPIPSRHHQRASRTEMTEYVLPQHANALGNVFGGQIMGWVDLCAAITAQRHSGKACVTAFVDDLKFEQPVKVGEVVRLRAEVSAVFNSSMEIEVEVEGEDSRTGRRWPCVHARLTFVAIDENGKPTPVAPLVMDSERVRTSQAEGELRRAQRLTKKPPSP
jgi:acyl-CoA hydrolase